MSDDLSLKWTSKVQVFDTLTEAMTGFTGEHEIFMHGKAAEILERERPKTTFQEVIHTDHMTTSDHTDDLTITHEGGNSIVLDDDGDVSVHESGSQIQETPHIFIRGTAIGEGVTRNLNEYLATELQRAAPTLIGVPLQLDHGRLVTDNAGKVLVSSYDPNNKTIDYIARFRMLKEKVDAFEAVKHGDIDRVSIGANIDDVLCNLCGESKLKGECDHHVGREYEGEIATRIGIGLEFFELSITPFGAYQGANIAGVVSQHSITLDDAIASFTESWKQKFGEQTKMSDQENTDQTAEVELEKTQKMLEEKDKENLVLVEQVKETLARTIADAEVEMGQKKPADLEKRIKDITPESVDALKLLSATTRERLSLFRHDQVASSRSQGIVSEEDASEDPTVVEAEELKDFLRQEWMKWPKPSESAKLTVRQFRSNSYNPNYNEHVRRQGGGK